MNNSLTVIVPCFNEEKNIEKCIFDLITEFKNLEIYYEILIINDCSKDNTKERLIDLKNKYSFLKIVNLKKNIGIGGVYKYGINFCKTSHLVLFPGDNEISAISLREATNFLNHYDIIITYPQNTFKRTKLRKYISFFFTIY